MLFVKKLQGQPKVKAVRSKIKKAKALQQKLSNEYRRVIKSEGNRLSRFLKRSRKKR